MKNSLHLISDPKTHLFYTPYQVSLRDAIYRNPKKYGIVLNSFNDLWMDKAFNLQLPMSSWDVEYSIAAGSKLEEKIVGSWYRIERKWEKNTTLKNLGKDKIALNRFSLFHLFVMHLNLLLEIVRHVTVQAFARDFSYLKRAWILINLKWWTRISLDDTDSSNGRFPQFFLKNSRLIKKYPWPFRKKWSIRLNPMELEILRYLYEPRKFDSIFTEFRTKYTRKAIQMILERHICLGSILQHKNMLMSIFHDPDYLQTITD